MFRTILKGAKSDMDVSPGMAELQELLSRISGPDGRNNLDPRALADLEDVVFNTGRPELVALYRRLLIDDIGAEKEHKNVGILPFSWQGRVVLERVIASVTNLLTFAERITAARRNERDRGGYLPSK